MRDDRSRREEDTVSIPYRYATNKREDVSPIQEGRVSIPYRYATNKNYCKK